MTQQKKIQQYGFDVSNPKCIRCDGINLTKIGSRNGKQRYRCEDCRRHFNGQLYVANKKFDIDDPKCVYCGSLNFIRDGAIKSGDKPKHHRFYCLNCESHFKGCLFEANRDMAKLKKLDINNPKCTRCGSSDLIENGKCNTSNKQRYICKICNHKFREGIYQKNQRKLLFNGLRCPSCTSLNLKFNGKDKKNGKQKYLCNKCGRSFREDSKYQSARYSLPKNITSEEMFNYDLWDIRLLGVEATSGGCFTITFSDIEQSWLKEAVKEWIRFKSAADSGSTLCTKMVSLRNFSSYLSQNFSDIKPLDINRNIIINYITHLSSVNLSEQTRVSRIGHIKHFLEDCARFDFINVTKEQLVYDEDYPKIPKALPRYIPQEILHKIKSNYDALPFPIVCAIEILLGTGIRTSKLLNLKFDCLEQDSSGAYWMRIYQRKMKKEISLVISKELASLVDKQKEYIRTNLDGNYQYLFCETKNNNDFTEYKTKNQWSNKPLLPLSHFEPKKKKLQGLTLRGYLHRFADELGLKNEIGETFPLGRLHQFRHTHGTELINNGVPQHIVQKRLGHESARMTNTYAHIHDKTMKQEMEKYWDGRVLNNQGEVVVSANPELDTAEMQWIKKNMKAQTLPDGFCGLPVTQSCPVQGSPCLTCSHLRTTMDFLDVHKKRLEETEKLIENARANGWNRQVETNLPIAENLRKIIRGLEQQEVVYGDESFPESEGGKENA